MKIIIHHIIQALMVFVLYPYINVTKLNKEIEITFCFIKKNQSYSTKLFKFWPTQQQLL